MLPCGFTLPRTLRAGNVRPHKAPLGFYPRTAMHSISTSAPLGSAAICTQLRAG